MSIRYCDSRDHERSSTIEDLDDSELRGRLQGGRARRGRDGKGRTRPRVGRRGLRIRQPLADGLPRGADRDGRDRRGDPAHLHAHADADRHDGGGHRRPLRRTFSPRSRRVGPPGHRGFPRRALHESARSHARDRRDLSRRLEARGAARARGHELHAAAAERPGTGLGKALKIICAPGAQRDSRSGSRRWARRTSR